MFRVKQYHVLVFVLTKPKQVFIEIERFHFSLFHYPFTFEALSKNFINESNIYDIHVQFIYLLTISDTEGCTMIDKRSWGFFLSLFIVYLRHNE